jgi:hypothetical protein
MKLCSILFCSFQKKRNRIKAIVQQKQDLNFPRICLASWLWNQNKNIVVREVREQHFTQMPMAISRGAIIEPKSANCAGRKSETMSSLSPLPTSSPFLSPLALVEAFARRNCSSLSVHSGAGKKVVAPTGVAEDSWIEDKEVEARVRAIADVVGEPRVAQRASLAEAEWDEERAAAKVTRAVGKHWETFGRNEIRTCKRQMG